MSYAHNAKQVAAMRRQSIAPHFDRRVSMSEVPLLTRHSPLSSGLDSWAAEAQFTLRDFADSYGHGRGVRHRAIMETTL